MQNMMKYAQLSSWTTSPIGPSPINQYEGVIEKAQQNISKRSLTTKRNQTKRA